ncbi:MAG: PqqD family protein [Acidimicrobiales bacterium]
MAAPLVVHLGAPDRLARRLAGPPSALARQVAGTSPARADVLVLHGRRARRVPRGGLALVVRRPAPGERPSRADRASLRRTDIVVVRDPGEQAAWAAALARPGAAVDVLADDDPDGWAALVRRALDPAPGVAARHLGSELLVAPAQPTGRVERLTGSGPAIWELLRAGRTATEAADALRPGDPEAQGIVEAFARDLARRGLVASA